MDNHLIEDFQLNCTFFQYFLHQSWFSITTTRQSTIGFKQTTGNASQFIITQRRLEEIKVNDFIIQFHPPGFVCRFESLRLDFFNGVKIDIWLSGCKRSLTNSLHIDIPLLSQVIILSSQISFVKMCPVMMSLNKSKLSTCLSKVSMMKPFILAYHISLSEQMVLNGICDISSEIDFKIIVTRKCLLRLFSHAVILVIPPLTFSFIFTCSPVWSPSNWCSWDI